MPTPDSARRWSGSGGCNTLARRVVSGLTAHSGGLVLPAVFAYLAAQLARQGPATRAATGAPTEGRILYAALRLRRGRARLLKSSPGSLDAAWA